MTGHFSISPLATNTEGSSVQEWYIQPGHVVGDINHRALAPLACRRAANSASPLADYTDAQAQYLAQHPPDHARPADFCRAGHGQQAGLKPNGERHPYNQCAQP